MANSFFIEQNADALPLYRLPIQCNATSYFLQELYVIILGLKNEQDVQLFERLAFLARRQG